MKYLRACVIAFAMYSRIPMPKVEWEKESMEYVMCFFPLVGVVIGGSFFLWDVCARWFLAGKILYAAGLTLLPVLITGGIHMDGFLDTMDAISSWQTRERRLEILKDPHAGAFAVIGGCMYFLAYFGLASELSYEGIRLAAMGFILSRCLSGIAVTAFPCAKDSGLVYAFSNGADKKRARRILILEAVFAMAGLLRLAVFAGGAVILISLLAFFWYYKMSTDQFGGITGDLAGWFLQMCELLILIPAAAAAKF